MAEMLGFCPVISRSGPEKPLYGTKNRSQSPWNRPIWGAAREFDFRDEFAADSPLQRRVCEAPMPDAAPETTATLSASLIIILPLPEGVPFQLVSVMGNPRAVEGFLDATVSGLDDL